MKLSTFLRWLAVFLVVLVISIAGSLPVFTLGLIVHEAVSNTLTLMTMGLLAAIGSSWFSNFFRIGGRRSQLLRIVVASETAAAILAIAYIIVAVSPAAPVLSSLFPRNIFRLVASGVLLTAAACLSARSFRSPLYNRRRDAIATIGLIGLAIVVVVVAMAVASLFGLTGA